MTRVTPRYIPTVQIYRPAKATKRALYYDWMVDQLSGVGKVKPGLVAGVRFTRLDDNATDFDGIPGLPSKVKSSALTIEPSNEWVDTRQSSWTYKPSLEELAARDVAKAVYNERVTAIQEQLATAKGNDKTELEGELKDAQAILDQLSVGGNGYLRTSYGAMDTKASGVFWGLAAPNVPVLVKSVFTLDRDRAFSFAYLRLKAPREQAQFRWIIGFGNGFTQYALAIGDDGNSSEFWHYRNMSEAKRAPLLAERETLLDLGRITVADRKKLLGFETEERVIRATAKARGGTDKKLTETESAQIEALHKQADELRDSKKLTPEQETRIQDLENQIFLERKTFKLQEESNDLLGKRVDVSVQFLRAGYVVVRSGQTEFVYENSRVTGLEPPQFHFGLPEKSRLTIQSDGGKWGFVFGHPKYEGGTILSQPWESSEALNPDDFESRIVGDLLSGSMTENGKVWNYGCSATARLVELKAPIGIQPGRYQLKLSLTSDGRYTPEIYYVGQYRPATRINTNGTLLWDSEAEENRNNGASRVLDTLLQDDRRRSRLAQVIIANGQGAANLPPHCGALACDVKLIDRENGDALVTALKHGFVGSHENDRVGEIETSSGFGIVPLHGNESVLGVTGCEGFLNRQIGAPVPADGMYPNDALRMWCQDAEMPYFLWSRIPEGNIGYEKIPATRPGRYPLLKPSAGSTFTQMINDVVRSHCKSAEFWSDALGVRLDKFAVRDRPELAYGTPVTGVAVDSHLCLRNQFKLTQDISDYVTSATFIGAKDPKTGQRFSKTVNIPQASDPAFEDSPYHIGFEIPYVSDADDSLRSDAACALAARDYLRKSSATPDGLAPWSGDIEVDFDATLQCGDLPRVFGVKFLVDRIEFAAFNSNSSGEDAGKARVLVQLAEDKTI